MRRLLLISLLVVPAPLLAQRDIARADSLLRAGRVASAESLYYAAAAARPRDPAARMALGRYIASRGATRVGAVLIEEAQRFGASPAVAATHLAPLYMRMRNWSGLARLDLAPLSAGERARAQWLAKNEAIGGGPESTTVTLGPGTDRIFGTVHLVVGSDTLVASLVPQPVGLVLDGTMAMSKGVRTFAGRNTTDSRQAAPIAAVVKLGAFEMRNEPVRFDVLGPRRALIGTDILARYAATVDPRSGKLTLRLGGRVAQIPAVRYPLVFEPRETLIAWQGRLQPLTALNVLPKLTVTRFTIDTRRGELVVE